MTETHPETGSSLPPAEPSAEAQTLPPDPAAYDSPRAVRARQKGLQAPYIAGGTDPDPAAGLAEERHYTRLLLGMAIAIVASGFVIGTVIALIGPAGGR
ncbi:MAG: hypothetical protein K0S97_1251 [Chloroflexota bacterium]|nr:hypothetical protein [Chloroflexota bacterium]